MILELVAETNTPWTTTYAPLITGGAALLGVVIGSVLQVALHAYERSQKYKDEIRTDIRQIASEFNSFSSAMRQMYKLAGDGTSNDELLKTVIAGVEDAYNAVNRLSIGLIICKDGTVASTASIVQHKVTALFDEYHVVTNGEVPSQRITQLDKDLDDAEEEVFLLMTIVTVAPSWFRKPLFRSRRAALKMRNKEKKAAPVG